MLVIRESFVAKPGNASKLAAMLKQVMKNWPDPVNIMTDVTGDMNHVVMETMVPDLAAFEARLREYGQNQALRDQMKGYTDMYLTGHREIYRIVE